MNIDLTKDVLYKKKKRNLEDYSFLIQKSLSDFMKDLENGIWEISENASKKFSAKGKYISFFGDTVVIPLQKEDIKKLVKYQKFLYEEIPQFLSDSIPPETFHVTVHDMYNELNIKDKKVLEEYIEEDKKTMKEIFENLAKYLKDNEDLSVVKLKATGLMGGYTAIGVVFVPEDLKSYRILLNLYNIFEEVLYLDYDYFPHVTLAYYKPIKDIDASKVLDTLKILNSKVYNETITLNLWDLSYQIFYDMKTYKTIFKLSDFVNR